MKLSRHSTLFISILIPIITTALIALSIYIPRSLVKIPEITLIYVTDQYSYPQYSFKEDGTITQQILPQPEYPNQYQAPKNGNTATLHLLHLPSNTTEDVSYEQIQNKKWGKLESLPNNFKVSRGSDSYNVLFSGPSYSQSWYISGNGIAQKLETAQSSRDSYAVEFIGWISP